eukprot:5349148-Prymnesium_polylepis.1
MLKHAPPSLADIIDSLTCFGPGCASTRKGAASSSDEKDEQDAGPIRFLCVHGSGSSDSVMRLQVRPLQALLKGRAHFEFVRGGVSWAPEDVEPGLVEMFKDGPYWGWWSVVGAAGDERGSCANANDYYKLLQQEGGSERFGMFDYKGVPEAVERVETALRDKGPFDVLVGFSQGAILVTIMTALRLRQERAGGSGPEWRCNMLACGMPPRDTEFADIVRSQALNFPAVALLGREDRFYEDGNLLSGMYTDATTLDHPGGHEFPPRGSGDVYARCVEELERRLASGRGKRTG